MMNNATPLTQKQQRVELVGTT